MLERASPSGHVVAFEPEPGAFRKLHGKLATFPNVTLQNLALGAAPGRAQFLIEHGPSPTHRVVGTPQLSKGHPAGSEIIEVRVESAKSYMECGGPWPNVVKIDVEGFEEQVLTGFGNMLGAPALRSILVEVHFQMLEERGERMAPARIERLLKSHGFKIRWIDASHLRADRN
jgi:FkbM family methyltransferase